MQVNSVLDTAQSEDHSPSVSGASDSERPLPGELDSEDSVDSGASEDLEGSTGSESSKEVSESAGEDDIDLEGDGDPKVGTGPGASTAVRGKAGRQLASTQPRLQQVAEVSIDKNSEDSDSDAVEAEQLTTRQHSHQVCRLLANLPAC